jgi:hypothetical protein
MLLHQSSNLKKNNEFSDDQRLAKTVHSSLHNYITNELVTLRNSGTSWNLSTEGAFGDSLSMVE